MKIILAAAAALKLTVCSKTERAAVIGAFTVTIAKFATWRLRRGSMPFSNNSFPTGRHKASGFPLTCPHSWRRTR